MWSSRPRRFSPGRLVVDDLREVAGEPVVELMPGSPGGPLGLSERRVAAKDIRQRPNLGPAVLGDDRDGLLQITTPSRSWRRDSR